MPRRGISVSFVFTEVPKACMSQSSPGSFVNRSCSENYFGEVNIRYRPSIVWLLNVRDAIPNSLDLISGLLAGIYEVLE